MQVYGTHKAPREFNREGGAVVRYAVERLICHESVRANAIPALKAPCSLDRVFRSLTLNNASVRPQSHDLNRLTSANMGRFHSMSLAGGECGNSSIAGASVQ